MSQIMHIIRLNKESVQKAGGLLNISNDLQTVTIQIPVTAIDMSVIYEHLTDVGMSSNDIEFCVGALSEAAEIIATARFFKRTQAK